MYDKVRMFLPRCRDMPDISQYLESVGEKTSCKGEISTYGFLDGLKVTQFMGGYVVGGSLSRFFYPSNIWPLSHHSTKEAIEKLSDCLHLDMSEANVTSLEFGTQFSMIKPVRTYLDKLGDMPKRIRIQGSPNALYYQGTAKTKKVSQKHLSVFYDKLLDARNKGLEIPPGFDNANLLRYEMRLSCGLPKQIGVEEVKASTLSDKAFFMKLLKMWGDEYFTISKHKTMKTGFKNEIKSPKDAVNAFIARMMSRQGKNEITDYINELKSEGVFEDPKYYTRLKNKLREISSYADFLSTDEDGRELDDCVRNTVMNY